jgi:2-polyprenyl-3-methyl-5-hydroxy-6-metoxy-1,4-benzoquinol methylase
LAALKELRWTPEMVRRFWDYVQTQPENYFSFQVGRVIANKFGKYIKRAKRIVDYGAGPGFLLEDLLHAGAQVGAVEFSPESLAELNRKFHGTPGFLGARNPDASDGFTDSFDVAFLVEVVEHLYDDELARCLSQVRSLLRPNGSLIVTTPNEEDRSKQFIVSPESGLLFHRFQHVRSWSVASLVAALESHGFRCVEANTIDFGASVHALSRTKSLPFRIARSIAKHALPKKPQLYAVVTKC